MTNQTAALAVAAAAAAAVLAACAGASLRQSRGPAVGANLQGTCDSLAAKIKFADTAISAVNDITAGTLKAGADPVPRHCLVLGRMNERTSAVDGKRYAIGFEMRLPLQWNGRSSTRATAAPTGLSSPRLARWAVVDL